MVENHTRQVKRLEVLPFLLQDFEAILLNSFIVCQLSQDQAGCQAIVAVHLHGFHSLALLLQDVAGVGTMAREVILESHSSSPGTTSSPFSSSNTW